jgi:hypothetical protein
VWREDPQWWIALTAYHSDLLSRAPRYFKCPIGLHSDIMLWPATLRETGNTFEHLSIHRWVVDQGMRRDPQTRYTQSQSDHTRLVSVCPLTIQPLVQRSNHNGRY